MAAAEYGTTVVFIHGNSNFSSSLLLKNSGRKINNSTFYTTDYHNKTLKVFIQPDIVSYNKKKYELNQSYVAELANMTGPLEVNYFVLISYKDTYTPAMHNEICNLPKLYGTSLNGNLYIIFLSQNTNEIGNSFKKSKELTELINNANNRYGIINESRGNFEIHIVEKGKNDLDPLWTKIITTIKYQENNINEGNNGTILADKKESVQPIISGKIPTKQIVRSFIIIGDDSEGLANVLNNKLVNSTVYEEIKIGTLVTKSANIERGFEIINISGLNNADIPLSVWYENLKSAIKESNPCICHTFLIVINLSDDFISYTTGQILTGLINIMNSQQYIFNNKAVLIFKYDNDHLPKKEETENLGILNQTDQQDYKQQILVKDVTQTILQDKIQTEQWNSLKKIVDSIENKLFINSICLQQEKVEEEIKPAENCRLIEVKKFIDELIRITKPTINMIVHGNTKFSQAQIRDRLNCSEGGDSIEIPHHDFKMKLQFMPDYTSYKDIKDQLKCLINGTVLEMIKDDKSTYNEIYVVIFLIDLEKQLDHTMKLYIDEMIKMYTEYEKDIWNHVVFLFKIPEGVQEQGVHSKTIHQSISLKEFSVTQAESRYILIKESTERDELINKLIELGKKVFAKCKGKDKVNDMLANQIIENSLKTLKKSGDITPESVYLYGHRDESDDSVVYAQINSTHDAVNSKGTAI